MVYILLSAQNRIIGMNVDYIKFVQSLQRFILFKKVGKQQVCHRGLKTCHPGATGGSVYPQLYATWQITHLTDFFNKFKRRSSAFFFLFHNNIRSGPPASLFFCAKKHAVFVRVIERDVY